MTANKHTPGPWRPMLTGRGGMVFHHVSATTPAIPGFCGERPIEIARISGTDPETDVANARLIAAAPDLLLALTKKVEDAEQRAFEDWLEFHSPSGDHEAVQRQWLESNDYRGFIGEWREQLDAIAKATGGAA